MNSKNQKIKKINFQKNYKTKITQTDDKFFWPGGCGGGPRFVFKFASVAITCCNGCCFCLFNVNFFVNSALKSSGPAPFVFEKFVCCEGGESFSTGGERFVVILPVPIKKIKNNYFQLLNDGSMNHTKKKQLIIYLFLQLVLILA